jgi:hypothetical protein
LCQQKALQDKDEPPLEQHDEQGRVNRTQFGRHPWISESLMAGNDITTVAKMAGTSITMIERVYGHFRNQHLHEAQARLDALRRQRER